MANVGEAIGKGLSSMGGLLPSVAGAVVSSLSHRKRKKHQPEKKDAPSGQRSAGDDDLPMLHKGGRVKRTGGYRLLKGERVLNRKQAKTYRKRSTKRAAK
jgi:hypothetical protein